MDQENHTKLLISTLNSHSARSLPVTDPPSLPAYNLRANSKYVEATFLFPHKNETSSASPEVIEAKKAKKEGYLPPY